MLTKFPLRSALFVSVCAFFALTIALSVVNPQKPVRSLQPGVNFTIIGLEMALFPEEVWNIIGDPDTTEGKKARAAFELGSWIDFGYIAAYSLCYFFLTALLVFRQGAHRLLLILGTLFIAITAFADVMENMAIFKILLTGTQSLIEQHLPQLIVFTRIKWLCLGLAGIPLVILFRKEGRRGPAFILTAAFAFGVLGLVKQYAVELMTLFLAFFWVYLFVKLLPLQNRWWPE